MVPANLWRINQYFNELWKAVIDIHFGISEKTHRSALFKMRSLA